MDGKKPLKHTASDALWERAIKVIPSGTQTFSKGPLQFVKGVAPKFIKRGKGSHVWDADGNEYIDYGMALGPIILGYAHPRVNEAIETQLKDGITYTLMHPLEVELAELLTKIVPCAEMVRFGKNGSDATAGAIRLARAHTKREKIACCGYHGWQDWFIGSTTRHRGVPQAVRNLTLSFRYNDIDSLKKLFDQNPREIAAVILEPTNFIEPKDDFLNKVKELAHKHGALLIFDEIITGFRMALGGAQEYFKVTPDIAAFGKAMGNGMPISSIVGRADIMKGFDEVFFSFTFGGEALSLVASLATIKELKEHNVVSHIWSMGDQLKTGYNSLAKELNLEKTTRCIGYGCWPEYEFLDNDGKPSYPLQTLFAQEIVKGGILTRSGMFICGSHSENDVAATLKVFRNALTVIREAIDTNRVNDLIEGELIQPVIRTTI